MRRWRIFFFFEILVKILPLISQLYQMNECGERVLSKNLPVVINSGRKKNLREEMESTSVVWREECKRKEKKGVLNFSPANSAFVQWPTSPPHEKT